MNASRIILVRYDEIGLKGKNRKFFLDRLLDNIKIKLSGMDNIRYAMPHGRILIYLNEENAEECVNRLQFIPGIASVSVGIAVERDFDAMADIGIRLIEPLLESQGSLKFCVRTNRADKSFPTNSRDCDFEVGSRIMDRLAEKGLVVNIKQAEFVFEIEIGTKETVLFHKRVPGLRGLPVGSSGEALCLISGGIDSPVAMSRMIRRGCRAHGIFFDNRPFLGRGGYDKVLRLSKIINRYQGGGRLYVVPFENIQVAIRDHCRPPNRVVLYRRMMYRIAEEVAREFSFLALVTGEALGQVASQTLENLAAVSRVVSMSVFRPLIGMDKVEIIALAKQLGTYEISIEPQPDCCSIFMPDRPATKTKMDLLEDDENHYPWQNLMTEAIKNIEAIEVDELV